jgi:hypothetical protein
MAGNRMKVAIITTVDHNVGDDFVREGIKYLLRKHFHEHHIKFENIHKHSPITSRHGFEWFRALKWSKRVDRLLPKSWSKDRVLDTDILVQSGAPVYWCHPDENNHCSNNEWYKPLIKDRYLKKKDRKKLLNLAAGTCQKYSSDGSEFCTDCDIYARELYSLADVTTGRDRLSKTVLNKIGFDMPVIPCSSIFAKDEHGLKSKTGEYVVVNYMKGGAHYTFGQDIDIEKWAVDFKHFYFELKKKERVIIACHNQIELDEVLTFDPDAEIFYQKDDYLAYMKFYSAAKFGIVNRVHAGFMLASFGKPSIVIGNDSRALMAAEIGLKHFFVNDVNFELLMHEYEYLNGGADGFQSRFKKIKAKAYQDYMNALSAL